MYENLTYEEIKNLPENKKTEAWSELHTIMPSNMELARKLNAAPIAISNAVKKYVLGEPVGRANKKNKPEQVEQIQQEAEQEPQQEMQEEPKQELQQDQPQVVKTKRKYNKRIKPEVIVELPEADIKADTKQEPVKSEEVSVPVSNSEMYSFLITVNKTVSGEDAQILLGGLANTLLKGQQYSIEVKIKEK